MAEEPNHSVLNCALLLLGAVATRRVRWHGLFSSELVAPAAALVSGVASIHGAAYAGSLGVPAWAMLALVSAGTLASAGHPFQYIEPLAERVDEVVETFTIAIGRSALVGLAASGVSLGILGVGISAALSACFQAHRAIRETAGLAMSILPACAGLALAAPAALSHRRLDVVTSIAAAQAAVSLAYARAP